MTVRDSFAEAKRALDELRASIGDPPRRRAPRGHPIREKLAQMLRDVGYPPNGLPVSAQGYHRITQAQAAAIGAKERDVRQAPPVPGECVAKGCTPRGAYAMYKGGRNAAALIEATHRAPTYYADVVVVPVSD